MPDHPLSARLDATWGDPATWVANGLQWTHLDEVQALINRRVSGDPGMSPLAWFAGHLAAQGPLPVRRVLVLGCGAGRLERDIHQRGLAHQIVAVDFSPKVLEVARQAAAGIDSIHYVLANMDDLPVGAPLLEAGSFDAVFGVSSVHHCSQLERLYAAVARLLVPGGWFFLDEYVGPDRFQYSDTHLEQVRALADLLPDGLLTTASGTVKRGFRAPTVDEVVAVDPSEAVCSSRILSLLPRHFDVVAQRPYGGSLLQLVLADAAQNFRAAHARPWLQALIDAEDDLDRQGALEHHFSCVIARQRPEASGEPHPAR